MCKKSVSESQREDEAGFLFGSLELLDERSDGLRVFRAEGEFGSKLPGALGGKSLDKDARAFEIAPSRGKSRGLGSKGRILRVTLEGKLERGIGALKCTRGLGDAVEQQRFDGAAAAFGERDGEDPFPRLGGAPRAILGMDARKLTEKDIEGRGGLDFILERFAKTKERGDGRRTG